MENPPLLPIFLRILVFRELTNVPMELRVLQLRSHTGYLWVLHMPLLFRKEHEDSLSRQPLLEHVYIRDICYPRLKLMSLWNWWEHLLALRELVTNVIVRKNYDHALLLPKVVLEFLWLKF